MALNTPRVEIEIRLKDKVVSAESHSLSLTNHAISNPIISHPSPLSFLPSPRRRRRGCRHQCHRRRTNCRTRPWFQGHPMDRNARIKEYLQDANGVLDALDANYLHPSLDNMVSRQYGGCRPKQKNGVRTKVLLETVPVHKLADYTES